jgi:hypothetical protein
MTFLRSLLTDLVEKRLWPIALLLAITAAAVPVVLGHGGQAASDAPAVLPAAPADAATASTPAVKLVGPASVHSRSGAVRDPFRRTKKPAAKHRTKAASRSGSGSTSTTKSATADAPAAAASTATKTAVATGATAAGAPAASGPSVYRTRVRWGQDAKADVHGVSRLQPLGGGSDPALLYLGTTKAGARAVFLLGPNASADGDGTCAEKTCRVLRLKAGNTTVVTVQGEDGGASRQYTLVIDDIARSATSSEAAAAKLRARVDHDGRDVLNAMIKDAATAAAIGQFRFDRTLGAVVAVSAP